MNEEDQLCRTCLNNDGKISLFDKIADGVSFADELKTCTSISVIERDSKSVLLCISCKERLQACRDFRLLCVKSDKALSGTAQKLDLKTELVDDSGVIDYSLTKAAGAKHSGQINFSEDAFTKLRKPHTRSSIRKKKSSRTVSIVKTDSIRKSQRLMAKPSLFLTKAEDVAKSGKLGLLMHFIEDSNLNKKQNNRQMKGLCKKLSGVGLTDSERKTKLKKKSSRTKEQNEDAEMDISLGKLSISNESTSTSEKSESSSSTSAKTIIPKDAKIKIKRNSKHRSLAEFKISISKLEPVVDKEEKKDKMIQDLYLTDNFQFVFKPKQKKKRRLTKYICDTCGYMANDSCSLSVHKRFHTGERPFVCTICNKSFVVSTNLKAHMLVHMGERSHVCSTCGKSFATRAALVGHELTHTGERPHVCPHCQRAFALSSNLRAHLRTHTGQRPYLCMTCGKSFNTSSDLTVHARAHTGEKPYSCDYCNKSFSLLSNLSAHQRIHTGERNYTCKDCTKTFTYKASLTSHSRVHSGIKQFSCNECGKSFAHANTLTSHAVVHTGARDYYCTFCQKSFARSSSLAAHIKKHKIDDAINDSILNQQTANIVPQNNNIYSPLVAPANTQVSSGLHPFSQNAASTTHDNNNTPNDKQNPGLIPNVNRLLPHQKNSQLNSGSSLSLSVDSMLPCSSLNLSINNQNSTYMPHDAMTSQSYSRAPLRTSIPMPGPVNELSNNFSLYLPANNMSLSQNSSKISVNAIQYSQNVSGNRLAYLNPTIQDNIDLTLPCYNDEITDKPSHNESDIATTTNNLQTKLLHLNQGHYCNHIINDAVQHDNVTGNFLKPSQLPIAAGKIQMLRIPGCQLQFPNPHNPTVPQLQLYQNGDSNKIVLNPIKLALATPIMSMGHVQLGQIVPEFNKLALNGVAVPNHLQFGNNFAKLNLIPANNPHAVFPRDRIPENGAVRSSDYSIISEPEAVSGENAKPAREFINIDGLQSDESQNIDDRTERLNE